jgi:hypothetical protein
MSQPNIEGWQGDLFMHGMTTCEACGDLIHQDEAIVHVYYGFSNLQEQVHFCSEHCKQINYMHRLRNGL